MHDMFLSFKVIKCTLKCNSVFLQNYACKQNTILFLCVHARACVCVYTRECTDLYVYSHLSISPLCGSVGVDE